MRTLRSLLKAYCWRNGGENKALTDAKNQGHYLKVKREDQNPNQNPLAELSFEKNPSALQKAQPGAHACIPRSRILRRAHPGVCAHMSLARTPTPACMPPETYISHGARIFWRMYLRQPKPISSIST